MPEQALVQHTVYPSDCGFHTVRATNVDIQYMDIIVFDPRI